MPNPTDRSIARGWAKTTLLVLSKLSTDATPSDPRLAYPTDPIMRLATAASLAAVAAVALPLLSLAALPLNDVSQLVLSGTLIFLLLALRQTAIRHLFFDNLGRFLRLLLLLIGVFITTRYLLWRAFYTLPDTSLLEFGLGVTLFAGEVFTFLIFILGAFVSLQPLVRPVAPLPEDRSAWPSVDVLIPSYNESPELLETTLLGAINIDYPADKINVYLLDDGATTAKRSQPSPQGREEAWSRRRTLKALCKRIGVHYLTRRLNHSAKAGNINDALPKVHGDLVLILDADHVPTCDILANTAGWFLRNPKLFLVQTPHFFVSPDPIEKNLGTFQKMPSEQEMFYTNIQRGLDFWNASFFCGSAAILRRHYLDEVGGIQGCTITEDAETALELHARGYDSAYIWQPMIAGLQPETFSSFVVQRSRWAQGMMQLFLLKNPLFLKHERGLHWWQKLCYLNSMMFWFFPLVRVIFLFAPLAYLLFGLGIFNADLAELLTYIVPHLTALVLIVDYLYGNVRWAFVSEFYELALTLFLAPPLLSVIRHPNAPSFVVTAKGEVTDQDAVSPLVKPVYWMSALTLIAITIGFWRLFFVPGSLTTDLVTLFWSSVNLFLLFGALGALFERQQRRFSPRFPCSERAAILTSDSRIPGRIVDLSATGMRLAIEPFYRSAIEASAPTAVEIFPEGGSSIRIDIDVATLIPKKGHLEAGCRVRAESVQKKAEFIRFAYGDSNRWKTMLRSRDRRVGVSKAALVLTRLMLKYGIAHFVFISRRWFKRRTASRRVGESVHSEQALSS